jgi:hypothetical protein
MLRMAIPIQIPLLPGSSVILTLTSLFSLVTGDSSKLIGYPPEISVKITGSFNSFCRVLAFGDFKANGLVGFAESFVGRNVIGLGQGGLNTIDAFGKSFHKFRKSDLEILDLGLEQSFSLFDCSQGAFRIVVTVRFYLINFFQIIVDIL